MDGRTQPFVDLTRMLKRNFKLVVCMISLALAGLIAIQVYWINKTVKLKKQEVRRDITEAMQSVFKLMEENAYCFVFKAKSYIRPGEGIYMMKHKWKDLRFLPPSPATTDTLEMYSVYFMDNDTMFFSDRNIMFNNPVTVDIDLKFEFKFSDSARLKNDKNFNPEFKNFTLNNYLDKLDDQRKVEEIINMKTLDSLLKKEIANIGLNAPFELGVWSEVKDSFVYLKKGSVAANLAGSDLRTPVMMKRKPKDAFQLVLYVSDPFKMIIDSMWMMMATSLLIILMLVFAFAYFIRMYLKQKKFSMMKNDFINNMTHEFKTPITNISLALENIAESADKRELYLKIIGEENEHMRENVERILQIAMLDRQEVYIEREELNLHELVHRVARSFEMQLAAVKGQISFDFDATRHHIIADETHIINMFYNLIDNAIKYSRSTPVIVVKTRDKGEQLVISITDNGIGMPEEVRKKIFDKFYRGSMGDTHDVKGFGLGLSYVKEVVDQHHGSIHVSSEPGKGSTFEISLPA
jgi:two-component system phosphate regulon sensor histidine kinase PhoR